MGSAYLGKLREDLRLEVGYFLRRSQLLLPHPWIISLLTGTASMTKSASDKASIFVECVMRDRVLEASSLEILSLAMSFSSSFSAKFNPLSNAL